MRERPLKHNDSFWGDLANAIALRPVYRRPVEAPQATKTVTLQPTAEPTASTAQQRADEKARTAEEKARTAVEHEVQEENTTAETSGPLYRYLKDEQERSFAPTPVKQEQDSEPSVLVIDGEEYVSVGGINISRSTIDRLLAKRAATITPPPEEKIRQSEGTYIEAKEAGFQRNESAVRPFQGRILDASEVLALSEAAKHLPAQILDKVILSSGVEIHKKVTNTNKSSDQRRVPFGAIRVSRARRLLNRKEKLKADDLKRLGFQDRQAIVLQGLYEGKGIRSIAVRLRTKPANVIHTVQQLMGTFDVSTADELLKSVWTMHRGTSLMTPEAITALNAVLGHGTTLGGQVIVHGHSNASKPVHMNIPAGHPDHPSNDEGAKKRASEGKPNPARNNDYPNISGT